MISVSTSWSSSRPSTRFISASVCETSGEALSVQLIPSAVSSSAICSPPIRLKVAAVWWRNLSLSRAEGRTVTGLLLLLDLPGLGGRGRIDVPGWVLGPDLESVLALLYLELVRRDTGLEVVLVELAVERRAGLGGGELERCLL